MTDDEKARWRDLVRGQLGTANTDAADRVKTQASIAADALKALLLANGGALIALFTFVGNVLAKTAGVRFDKSLLYWAFGLFVAGFTLGLVAHVLAFLSQDRFYHQAIAEAERMAAALQQDAPELDQTAEITTNRQGNRFYAAGVATAVLSVTLFAIGCGFALRGVLIG